MLISFRKIRSLFLSSNTAFSEIDLHKMFDQKTLARGELGQEPRKTTEEAKEIVTLFEQRKGTFSETRYFCSTRGRRKEPPKLVGFVIWILQLRQIYSFCV